MGLSAEELAASVAELVASPELWRTHVRPAGRDRAFELIWADEQVNAWVICWSADHDTGFHDHDESAAAVAVIEGEVREDGCGSPPVRRPARSGPGRHSPCRRPRSTAFCTRGRGRR